MNGLFFRYFFNWSNIFVIFLVFSTIGFCFYETNTYQAKESGNTVVTARFVEEKSTYFGQSEYILQLDNQISIATKQDNLDLGKKYLLQVKSSPLNQLDRSDLYNLGQGIHIKIDKYSVIQELGCDVECRGIQYLAQTRKYIDRTFQELSCHSHFWIGKYLAPSVSCGDIGTLSKGLVIGGVSFTDSMKKDIRKAGITHIVAVSGFQVTLLALFIEFIVSKLNIHRNKKIAITIIILVGFALLVGFEPPILRALIMALMVYFIQLLGRGVPTINVIIYSAILLLFTNPFLIYSASFQLSYLASFALATVPKFQSLLVTLNTIIKQVIEIFIASFWIFVWTTPVIVFLSGSFSPLTILTNTVIVPFIPVITMLDILSLIPLIGEVSYIPVMIFESLLLESITNIQLPVIYMQFSQLELVGWYGMVIIISMVIKWRNLQIKRLSI